MQLTVNNIYHGFKLLSIEQVKEINSAAYMFEHLKSGAKLLFLENDDENKVFSISFRTTPSDSTGVAHILEHSVLCGSRKFPLKEPFVELVKGSLNTFLNAMTFPDKTMYPIASMNDKDFRNLMEVYLDAVFYPNIYQNKYLLKQEGWHYSLDENDRLIYKGVVYNEMKGVYSSPESVLEQASMEALFPDTTYGFESGGHPDNIPELTQEAFERFHATYYHPSNSYLYLYGKLDIAATLEFIDREYLRSFDRIELDSSIAVQAPFARTKVRKVEYPLTEGESTENRSFFDLAFVVGEPSDMPTYVTLSILNSILVNMPGAPLKQALLDAGVAQDIFSSMQSSLRQNVFTISAAGADENKHEEFVKVIYATLNDLVHSGLDKELLKSALNIMEFKLREADFGNYPKGLIYGIRVMDTWLYDGSPTAALRYDEVLAQMRANIQTRYFESFIENYLLDNTHRALVVLTPKIGLEAEKNAALAAHLAEVKAAMSEAELAQIRLEMQELQEMQTYIDPPEVLEKIPLLAIEDIEHQVRRNDYEVCEQDGVQYVYQPAFTNKIVYLEGHFSAAQLPENLILYYNLLTDLLKQLSTTTYSYFELSKQISLHTGGIGFVDSLITDIKDTDAFMPKLSFVAKCLNDKLDTTLDLVEEVLLRTDFSDKKRLQELINEVKTSIEGSMAAQGNSVAAIRLSSYFCKSGAFAECGNLNYYYFLCSLRDNFDELADGTIDKLRETITYIVKQQELVLGFSCEPSEQAAVMNKLQAWAGRFAAVSYPHVTYELPVAQSNEGIYTPGMVQYVAMGGDFQKAGFDFHGSLRVVETLLKYEYLWTNIRVQGGAYGAMINLNRNGLLQFISYRDPNLRNTVKVYQGIGAYLQQLELSEREILKYIIGTISKVDTPVYNSGKLHRSVTYHLMKISDADLQKNRDEILNTGIEDIRRAGALIEAVIATNNLCVVGSENAVKEAAELFNIVFAATKGA